jgi:hypothetical protein
VWEVRTSTLEAGTLQWRLLDRSGREASFSQILSGWASDGRFRSQWSDFLRGVPLSAYAWECPPVTAATASRPFECVFVSSPELARMRPEPEAFAEHFRPDTSVVTFANLGGDAMLVAPCPAAQGGGFAHLASFVATATPGHASDLWQAVGTAMQRRLGASPVWLSTAGLGVAWLHVRLDSRPKYYRHAPYLRP